MSCSPFHPGRLAVFGAGRRVFLEVLMIAVRPRRLALPLLAALALVVLHSAARAPGAAPVHAAATDIVPLFAGCNNVATTWSAGTDVRSVFEGITPASAVESIWRYDNASARFSGWSPLPVAPNDYTNIIQRTEPVFVCMRENGEMNRPTI